LNNTVNAPIIKISCVKKNNGLVVEIVAKEKVSWWKSKPIIITPKSLSYRFKSKEGDAIIMNNTTTNPISLISLGKDGHNLLNDFNEC